MVLYSEEVQFKDNQTQAGQHYRIYYEEAALSPTASNCSGLVSDVKQTDLIIKHFSFVPNLVSSQTRALNAFNS